MNVPKGYILEVEFDNSIITNNALFDPTGGTLYHESFNGPLTGFLVQLGANAITPIQLGSKLARLTVLRSPTSTTKSTTKGRTSVKRKTSKETAK